MKEHVIQKAPVFVSRCKVWRLKNGTVRRHFVEEVEKRATDRSKNGRVRCMERTKVLPAGGVGQSLW